MNPPAQSSPRGAAPGSASPLLAPPPSVTHETPAGQFVATGVLLRPLQAEHAPLAQVTLSRLEPHRVALERALRALPLSGGQMAVCRELLTTPVKASAAACFGSRHTCGLALVHDRCPARVPRLEVRFEVRLDVRLEVRQG